MIELRFPEPQFRIKKEKDKQYIFDEIRRMWLLLTEEEWVRQNFINYLTVVLHYPSSLIALEKEIWLHDVKKRFDILVYGREHKPWMMIECKAPQVQLSENVLQQLLRYNMSVPVSYLLITNGDATIGWKKEEQDLRLLQELPAFNQG
jgi:hypothetical protein